MEDMGFDCRLGVGDHPLLHYLITKTKQDGENRSEDTAGDLHIPLEQLSGAERLVVYGLQQSQE